MPRAEIAPPGIVDLFQEQLPAMSAEMAEGRAGLNDGMALYHMTLEGMVLSAGQRALLEDLDDGALPGVREGVYHVELDERWHIGFGLRCLIDRKPSPDLIEGIMAQAEESAEAWGDALPDHIREAIVPMARRRLAYVTRQIDLQRGGGVAAGAPVDAAAVRPALSRVGLTGVEAVVRLGVDERSAQPFAARIECMVEPERRRDRTAGASTTWWSTWSARSWSAPPACAPSGSRSEIAERVRERLQAPRAEVTIAARFPERRPAPVSGTPTQEISTLHARRGGVRARHAADARRLRAGHHDGAARAARCSPPAPASGSPPTGFDEAAVARVARRRAGRHPRPARHRHAAPRLPRGLRRSSSTSPRCSAIVEGAMSSEIFELMKRSDEGAVVERAHRRPRAADDCVRAMIAGVVEHFAGRARTTVFVSAAQESFETLHRHCLMAERAGCSASCAASSRAGASAARRRRLRERWLDAPSSPARRVSRASGPRRTSAGGRARRRAPRAGAAARRAARSAPPARPSARSAAPRAALLTASADADRRHARQPLAERVEQPRGPRPGGRRRGPRAAPAPTR